MSKKLPYPDWVARSYPPGINPEKRKIVRCSRPDRWYNIGDIITVHYFATYGCWDTEGRWIDYYDLSRPIKKELTEKERKELMNAEHGLIKEAKDYMNKWDDIPISMQLPSLCKILKIKEGNAAINFCTGLLIGNDADNAKILFETRNHEYA